MGLTLEQVETGHSKGHSKLVKYIICQKLISAKQNKRDWQCYKQEEANFIQVIVKQRSKGEEENHADTPGSVKGL